MPHYQHYYTRTIQEIPLFQCSENVIPELPLHTTEFKLQQELSNELFNEKNSNQTGREKNPSNLLGTEEGETTTTVYAKALKEAVCARRHSTNTSVSVITYIQPRRGEERQVPLYEGFPLGNYTSNKFLTIRSVCTMAC